MTNIKGHNVPEIYVEAFWAMKVNGVEENSRNGKVLTIPEPVLLEITHPLERVLFDPDRNANPFFHVMETIWMFAGSNHVGFPSKFNSTYAQYAEEDGFVHGAYGKRWRNHFQPKEIGPKYSMDQIQLAIAMLRKNTEDRRVVLSMWDTPEDLGATKKDLPCNTHIYLRARRSDNEILGGHALDITVCNRSNDLIWGCLGANVVHFTYLHELLAFGAGMEVGTYRIFTNNLHVYSERPDVARFMEGPVRYDPYTRTDVDYYALLDEGESVEQFFADCEDFIQWGAPQSGRSIYQTKWINDVALPMLQAWNARVQKRNDDAFMFIDRIKAKDWRLACRQWVERRIESSAT